MKYIKSIVIAQAARAEKAGFGIRVSNYEYVFCGGDLLSART